jgi:hypothetical protein
MVEVRNRIQHDGRQHRAHGTTKRLSQVKIKLNIFS